MLYMYVCLHALEFAWPTHNSFKINQLSGRLYLNRRQQTLAKRAAPIQLANAYARLTRRYEFKFSRTILMTLMSAVPRPAKL